MTFFPSTNPRVGTFADGDVQSVLQGFFARGMAAEPDQRIGSFADVQGSGWLW